MEWEPRTYRRAVSVSGLRTFEVSLAETDLQISALRELPAEALALVASLRGELEAYIASHPRFSTSFVPIEVEPLAPEIVQAMASAAERCGVGPMAAVAGAIAERVARGLAAHSSELVVENGGDLYLIGSTERSVAVWTGDSAFGGGLTVSIPADMQPCAVCTSSGRIGHSDSFGSAQTVTVIAVDGALADAAATAIANRVHRAADAETALAFGRRIDGVRGVLVVVGETVAAWGTIQLAPSA
jgi:hypothetical protein